MDLFKRFRRINFGPAIIGGAILLATYLIKDELRESLRDTASLISARTESLLAASRQASLMRGIGDGSGDAALDTVVFSNNLDGVGKRTQMLLAVKNRIRPELAQEFPRLYCLDSLNAVIRKYDPKSGDGLGKRIQHARGILMMVNERALREGHSEFRHGRTREDIDKSIKASFISVDELNGAQEEVSRIEHDAYESAENVRTKMERRIRILTYISFVTYPLGSLLVLSDKMLGGGNNDSTEN